MWGFALIPKTAEADSGRFHIADDARFALIPKTAEADYPIWRQLIVRGFALIPKTAEADWIGTTRSAGWVCHHNCSWSGSSSGGTFLAGAPWSTKLRSHWHRVTKIILTFPSGGRCALTRSAWVSCLAFDTQERA